MDKTININIAGTLFKIDEDAYQILRDYLYAINNRFRNTQGGLETVEDIESRIAEIFQSQKGLAGVITKESVEAMISIIGKPEDFDQIDSETESKVYTSRTKKMYRNPDDSIISGVCGGIGVYLNTEPVLFRILFVLFTLFYGMGFFVYIALWIALPSARTDSQKREMYGDAYNPVKSHGKQTDGSVTTPAPLYTSGYNNTSKAGNAFNEIFRALGKVGFIICRIFMIFVGIVLVMTGFIAIIAYVMIFFFHYPEAFSSDSFTMGMTYFPDFLNYIVNPATVPWIIALTTIVFILPTLAIIYWGVKMIFWFKAKDGVFSIVALVLWVVALTALSIVLFREGVSFAQTAKSSSQIILPHTPDTLYVMTDHKVSDLKFDKEISFNNEEYAVYINDGNKELYIRPCMDINRSHDDIARIEVRKRSSGSSKINAKMKTEELLYNYRVNGDTLMLDDYFTIPAGRRWSADVVHVNLNIPEGIILKFDRSAENLFLSKYDFDDESDFESGWKKSGNRSWILTDEGLKPAKKISQKQK
ncbi:MAG: PspC domain-containing protein [Bacteroidales bacterium]|nr:PspC domain-containing protein [Bacteroidales bacterium]